MNQSEYIDELIRLIKFAEWAFVIKVDDTCCTKEETIKEWHEDVKKAGINLNE